MASDLTREQQIRRWHRPKPHWPADCWCEECRPDSWRNTVGRELEDEIARLKATSPPPSAEGEARATIEVRASGLPGFIWKRITHTWWGLFSASDAHAADVWDQAENNRRAWEEHEARRAARGFTGAPEPYDADADGDPFTWHTWGEDGIGGENASERTLGAAMREVEAALVRQRWHGAAAPASGEAHAPEATLVAVCLRCSRAFTEHPHAKDDRCAGFVDDPAAPCLACGKRYDAHPTGGGRCPSQHSPWDFQAPAAYYCENRRCTWRSYVKPCERRCHACGATVWKDHSAGHKPRPALVIAAGRAIAPTPMVATVSVRQGWAGKENIPVEVREIRIAPAASPPSPKDADEGAERNEGNEGGGR
jgi:hypothetical protein